MKSYSQLQRRYLAGARSGVATHPRDRSIGSQVDARYEAAVVPSSGPPLVGPAGGWEVDILDHHRESRITVFGTPSHRLGEAVARRLTVGDAIQR